MKLGEFIVILAIVGIVGAVFDSKVSKMIAEKDALRLVIAGQEATIAAYKDNLTSCLKESRVATQDEFTGE